jgi:hypothetical protein
MEDEDMDMDDAVEDLGDDMDDDDVDVEDADEVEDADDVEVDMDMDMDSEEHDDEAGEHDAEQDTQLHDLEQAIAELKAEFEAMKSDEGEHMDADAEGDDQAKMAESWESETDDLDEDEDYADLEEAMDLDTVTAAKGGEVGSGKFARAEANTRSPVPTTQKDTMGAGPVVTGKGSKVSGYDRQTAPSSHELSGTANRRKKSTDGMSAVSKEGSAKAMLNKDRSEGFGAPGTRSPISGK